MNTPDIPLRPNFLAGRWQRDTGTGQTLFDPVLGTPLLRVDRTSLDLAEGFAFAREQGGTALRALSYRQRAAPLGEVVKVLHGQREACDEIATEADLRAFVKEKLAPYKYPRFVEFLREPENQRLFRR